MRPPACYGRYLLLHVYEPANEEGGELWDAVCGHLLIGLAIFQLTCIGLLTVKGAKEQVLLAFPLPFLTVGAPPSPTAPHLRGAPPTPHPPHLRPARTRMCSC